MLITTIILLLLSLYFLITGRAFMGWAKDITQYAIDELDGKLVDKADIILKCLMVFGFAVVMLVVNLVYLSFAYPIDILKFPTLLMALWLFLPPFFGFVKGKLKPKPQKTPEQARAKLVLELQNIKRYTVQGILSGVLRVTYFGYMLWIILGGN